MSARNYLKICLAIFLILSYEYLVLNSIIRSPSLLRKILQVLNYPVTPSPGKPLSFFFGIVGFLLICLTNLYILRKHLQSWHKLGKLSGWFEFHVFCGMLGPIFIVFHSNFKIGGLVAVSFWSMMISATSGIIGRYFYTQLLQTGSQLHRAVQIYDQAFNKYCQRNHRGLTLEKMVMIKKNVLRHARVDEVHDYGKRTGLVEVILRSIVGEVQLLFAGAAVFGPLSTTMRGRLREYARIQRRLEFHRQFKQMMGYWHSFHLPFAVFMYVVAVLHIIVALMFRIRS